MNKELEKFFLKENKSGYKTRKNWLIKNNPDLYKKIEAFSINHHDISFIERVFLYIHNLKNVPRCLECNKKTKFKGTLKRGYSEFCSIKCLNKSSTHKEKIKKSNIKKYGFDSHNKHSSVKKKKRDTYLKRFGVENPMYSPSIRKKQITTIINKYGVDNPMKIDYVINQHKNNLMLGVDKNVSRHINKTANKNIKFVKQKDGLNYFKCLVCGNEFKAGSNLINSRLRLNINLCLICNKNKSYSNLLNNFTILFNTHNIKYELNNRKILSGKEIDIYLPNQKIGIEVNGLYWHSSLYKDKNYHMYKTDAVENMNIKLFHFFEDEIMDKFNIISSIILNELKLNKNKIYARKCKIKEINNKTYKQFLIENHIQGYVPTKIKYGLFYNNNLISIMGFGSKRLSLGNKTEKENEFEMLRFCNKLNTTVIGGASKLLKHFIKNHANCKIISYANRRYSKGGLYEKLGFSFLKKTKPNYYYVKPGTYKRENRFKYRKSVLVKMGFESSKTEELIMRERKYYRIYDSGQLKYELVN